MAHNVNENAKVTELENGFQGDNSPSVYIESESKPINAPTENINDDRLMLLASAAVNSSPSNYIRSPPILISDSPCPETALASRYDVTSQECQVNASNNSLNIDDGVDHNGVGRSSSSIKKHVSIKRHASVENVSQSDAISSTDSQVCKRMKNQKIQTGTPSLDLRNHSTSESFYVNNSNNDDDNDSSSELNLYNSNNTNDNSSRFANLSSIRLSSSLFRPINETNNDCNDVANPNDSINSKNTNTCSQATITDNDSNAVASSSNTNTVSTHTTNNNSEFGDSFQRDGSVVRCVYYRNQYRYRIYNEAGGQPNNINGHSVRSSCPAQSRQNYRSVEPENNSPNFIRDYNSSSINQSLRCNLFGRSRVRTQAPSFPRMQLASSNPMSTSCVSGSSYNSIPYQNADNSMNQSPDIPHVRVVRFYYQPFLPYQAWPSFSPSHIYRQIPNCHYIRNNIIYPQQFYNINSRVPPPYHTSTPPTYSFNDIHATHSSFAPYRRRLMLNSNYIPPINVRDVGRRDNVPANNNNDDATATTTTTTTSNDGNNGSGHANTEPISETNPILLDSPVNTFLRAFGMDEIRQRQLLEREGLLRNMNEDLMPELMLPIFPEETNLFNLNANVEQVIQMALHIEASTNWKGLNNQEISQLPTHKHKQINDDLENEKCVICLEDLVDEQFLRTLVCKHYFHMVCVDRWLKVNRSCPMCRMDALGIERNAER